MKKFIPHLLILGILIVLTGLGTKKYYVPNKSKVALETWGKVEAIDKVLLNLDKDKYSVEKIKAEKNSYYLLFDESYEGKEVYLVTFEGDNASDADGAYLIDKSTYEIIGTNLKS